MTDKLKLFKGFLYLRGIDEAKACEVMSHEAFENYDIMRIEERETEIAIVLETLVRSSKENSFVNFTLYHQAVHALQDNGVSVNEDSIDIDNYSFINL